MVEFIISACCFVTPVHKNLKSCCRLNTSEKLHYQKSNDSNTNFPKAFNMVLTSSLWIYNFGLDVISKPKSKANSYYFEHHSWGWVHEVHLCNFPSCGKIWLSPYHLVLIYFFQDILFLRAMYERNLKPQC